MAENGLKFRALVRLEGWIAHSEAVQNTKSRLAAEKTKTGRRQVDAGISRAVFVWILAQFPPVYFFSVMHV